MSQGIILPLIAEIRGGSRSAALMNDKSFSKSRENGILWICHPETGRILPYKGDPEFLSLEKKGHCYYAELPEGCSPEAYDAVFETVDVEEHASISRSGSEDEHSSILGDLTRTIAKRHRDMPEGSYTTHLFQKGSEKIRKKTGEEAIELVLAKTQDDIIYESADLIYHLMVLLEAEDLSIQDVLLELKKRDS